MDPTTIQIIISLGGIIGAGFSVFLALKLSNSENRLNITHLTQTVTILTQDVRDIVNKFNNHQTGSNHVQPDAIRRIEHELVDMKKENSTNYDKVQDKLDKAAEQIHQLLARTK